LHKSENAFIFTFEIEDYPAASCRECARYCGSACRALISRYAIGAYADIVYRNAILCPHQMKIFGAGWKAKPVAVPNEQGNRIQPALYFMKRPHMGEFIDGFPAFAEGFL
jgi:hypothetical protein